MRTELSFSDEQHQQLCRHLFREGGRCEEGAFLHCSIAQSGYARLLSVTEMTLLPADAFLSRSSYYLELKDDTRASVMKRAHDLNAVLVEVHSHPLQQQAQFSPSDLSGFETFVPYVNWRLPGRPYVAIVHAVDSFDALVWEQASATPQTLDGIAVDGRRHVPTGHTLKHWR